MKFPEQYRWKDAPKGFNSFPGEMFGVFQIPFNTKHRFRTYHLNVIANAASEESEGWDHVSVTISNSLETPPTWEMMCAVKDLFWDKSECVIQFHPPESEYVNTHPGCLHLWRNTKEETKTPPKGLV